MGRSCGHGILEGHILWTGVRPSMSKPLAMTAAVASHRSILHMLTFTTSPGERERESGDGK